MSLLTFVRHAQASFFQEDYDRLSPLGHEQARMLGEYWAKQGVRFNEVYAGPRARQQQTAELAGAACRRVGLSWPATTVLNDCDEYDLSGMMHLVPQLALANAEFAALRDAYQRGESEHEKLRSFQAMFESVLHHWQTVEQASQPAETPLETWPRFRQRVERAIAQLREKPGRGRRIALFTSGGFIGTAVQHVLGAPDRAALELNWRVRNCSLTELVFTHDRLSLDSFNMVPHLSDMNLWTYR